MTLGAYLLGVAVLVVGLAALIWGAVRLRESLLPAWRGPPALLADTMVAIGVAVGLSELLGLVGAFRRGPVLVSFVVFALAVRVLCPRQDRSAAVESSPPLRRGELAVATFGVTLVVGQWTTQVIDTFRHGMTHADTIWYHGPHAVRFLQDGSITQTLGFGGAQETYNASNGELIDAIAMLPFHTDVLVPLVNFGWMVIALLAAWCVGRSRGVGATCMLGAAMVLSLPVLAGSQAGQASNDIPAAALLVAAVALLLTDPRRVAAVGVAAVTAGLAVATKPTVGSAVAIITVGVLIAAFQARRAAIAAMWVVGVTVAGSYWYAKNLVTVGNPFPGVQIGVGRFSLPLVTQKYQCCTVAQVITKHDAWRDTLLPGLRDALTNVWPLVLALTLLGGVLTAVTGRGVLERVVGAAVLGNAVGYLFTPLGAGGIFNALFVFNLRHLTAALLLGCVLLPRCPIVSEHGRWWMCSVPFMVALLFGYFARHYEHAPAWPIRYAAGVGFAIALAAALLILVVRHPPSLSRLRPVQPALVVVLVVALLVLVGWPIQRAYFDGRYREAGRGLAPFSLAFNDRHHRRVALFGSAEEYVLLGADLTNVVRRPDPPRQSPKPTERARLVESCRAWRTALRADPFDYVVVVFGSFTATGTPEPWVSRDPASSVVDRSHNYRVIHLSGPVHPEQCPQAAQQ